MPPLFKGRWHGIGEHDGVPMRTADTIAQQSEARSEHAPKQPKRELPQRLIDFQWKKGQSGNPGGRPKRDFAAEFARKILEANGDENLLNQYANGFAKQLRKGNAYTFKELAERGFGKLVEKKELTGANGGPLEFKEVDELELNERIAQLERDLGLARTIDEAGRIGSAAAGESKANGKAE